MVKFVIGNSEGHGAKVIGIGLTDAEMEFLAKDKPVHIKMSELTQGGVTQFDAKDEILLFYGGKDDDAILKTLRDQPNFGRLMKDVQVQDYRPKPKDSSA